MDSCLEQGPLRPRASAPGVSEVLPAPVLRGPGPPGRPGAPGTLHVTAASLFLQETGLYYKKFLAYPWILTIMWPEKLVTRFAEFWNGAVPRGFLPSPKSAEPAELVSGSPCGAGALVVDEGLRRVPGSARRAPRPGSWRPAGLRPHRVLTGARGAPPDLTPSRPHWLR